MTEQVFLYGTLLPGMVRHAAVARAERLDHGWLDGCQLHDLGAYPAVQWSVDGQGRVMGEVYAVCPATLRALDKIEGVNAEAPAAGLYRRQRVTVQGLSGSQYNAWVYVYNRPLPTGAPVIVHGDYRRYLLEKQGDGLFWYLAFGANMEEAMLRSRVGELQAPGEPVWLQDYRLCFNKLGVSGGGRANLHCFAGADTPAVAWQLTRQQLSALDGYEGAPRHYLRVVIRCLDRHQCHRLGQAYLAHPGWLASQPLSPPLNYLCGIHRAYAGHGFPRAGLPPLPDPDDDID